MSGTVTSGESEGFLRGSASQWVDDLRRLPDEYGFDMFVFWNEGDEDDPVRRFAEDVVPAARET